MLSIEVFRTARRNVSSILDSNSIISGLLYVFYALSICVCLRVDVSVTLFYVCLCVCVCVCMGVYVCFACVLRVWKMAKVCEIEQNSRNKWVWYWERLCVCSCVWVYVFVCVFVCLCVLYIFFCALKEPRMKKIVELPFKIPNGS